MSAEVRLGGRALGPGRPAFIIAEAGVNHNGSLDMALGLVAAAHAAGADAVKFQTFRAADLVTPDAAKAAYQNQTTGGGTQLEMLKALELSPADHRALLARCGELGIAFLSTPFESRSLQFLLELGVSALKIPSGEVPNLPFLRAVGAAGVPVILSTGMASLGEVEEAVLTLEEAGCEQLVLLHCLSCYPAPFAEVNLRAMDTLAVLGWPVGYSDHTLGDEVALGAVARGAVLIEKHFTLDKTLPGPDHQASLEPAELADLVRRVRHLEAALGDGRKRPAPCERNTAAVIRKSLVAARDLPAGAELTEDLVAIKRPGTGLSPRLLPHVLGRRLRRPLAAGQLIALEDLA